MDFTAIMLWFIVFLYIKEGGWRGWRGWRGLKSNSTNRNRMLCCNTHNNILYRTFFQPSPSPPSPPPPPQSTIVILNQTCITFFDLKLGVCITFFDLIAKYSVIYIQSGCLHHLFYLKFLSVFFSYITI